MPIWADQTIPEGIAAQNITSAVVELSFDHDLGLVQRDGGRISVRIDYSND